MDEIVQIYQSPKIYESIFIMKVSATNLSLEPSYDFNKRIWVWKKIDKNKVSVNL